MYLCCIRLLHHANYTYVYELHNTAACLVVVGCYEHEGQVKQEAGKMEPYDKRFNKMNKDEWLCSFQREENVVY